MSCFRCGNELPEGQVECDPPCDEAKLDFERGKMAPGKTLTIQFELLPDDAVHTDRAKQAAFRLALHRWMRAIAYNFSSTGLNRFCKSVPPEEGE